MRARVRILACCVGLAISPFALAGESIYQDLPFGKERCVDLSPISEKDQKEMEEMGQDIPWALHCQGYKEYKILNKWDRRAKVLFGHLSDQFLAEHNEDFDADSLAGDKIEWRLDDTGTPRAAILRYKFSNYNFNEKPLPEVLLVSKVGQPDSPASCAIGMVDASANKNANELARKVADEVADGFQCGRDMPEYHGKRSKTAPNMHVQLN
jgi:hypothetical protein